MTYYTIQKFYALLKQYPDKKLFHFNELALLMNMRPESLKVKLSRWHKAGLIAGPTRGWYYNVFNMPTLDETALLLSAPAYLSYERLLSMHGILSQHIEAPTVASLTRKTPLKIYHPEHGTGIVHYHQISRKNFFGYYMDKDGLLKAYPEKALLDWLNILVQKKSPDAIKAILEDVYLDELNMKRFTKLASRMSVKNRAYFQQIVDYIVEEGKHDEPQLLFSVSGRSVEM